MLVWRHHLQSRPGQLDQVPESKSAPLLEALPNKLGYKLVVMLNAGGAKRMPHRY